MVFGVRDIALTGKTVVNVTVNRWLSKTFCSKNPCWIYEAARNIAILVLKRYSNVIIGAKTIVVKGWQHYCGVEPRWLRITAVFSGDDLLSLAVHGGVKWRLAYLSWQVTGSESIVLSDGCWDFEDVIRMLEKNYVDTK